MLLLGWGRGAGGLLTLLAEKKEKIQPCIPLPTPTPTPDHLSPPLPASLAISTCHPCRGTPERKASPANYKS